MNPNCPQCGIQFEREAGYFLGAMYYSYGMSGLSLIPLGVITWIYDPPVWFIGGVAILQAVILTPVFFRYSRVLWLHMDQRFDPR